MSALGLALLAWAARANDAPAWIVCALALPAVLWAPGLGLARRLGGGQATGLQVAIDAAWISTLLAVVSVSITRALGADPSLVLGLSAVWGLIGAGLGRRAPWPPHSPRGAWGAVVGVIVALLALVVWRGEDLRRPLDGYWWSPDAEALPEEPGVVEPGAGFGAPEVLGWPEQRAMRFVDPDGDGGTLRVGSEGAALLLLRGPVGARLQVGDAAPVEITADVVEVEEEGAVPRYLDRGIVAALVPLRPGEVQVTITGVDGPAELALIPGREGVWSLHSVGAYRFVHYYQLLNIVENLRWAEELWVSRALTVNQPPLWSYPLAVATGLGAPGLLGANALLLGVLLLLGAACAQLIATYSPDAPAPAWALPALAAVTVGHLMIEPGSTTFPDPLYAAAMVSGVAALGAPWRFGAVGVLSGALRYPGVVALSLFWAVGAALGLVGRRPLGALWGLTGALGLTVGAYALVTGQLSEWLEILWFETGPEHYHGETSPSALLPRVPEFYGTWLWYTGGGLLCALPLAGRGARLCAIGAGLYSLMLCTIDHHPTHYFLPLVALSACAVATNAAALERPALRWGLPCLALVGGLWFLGQGAV